MGFPIAYSAWVTNNRQTYHYRLHKSRSRNYIAAFQAENRDLKFGSPTRGEFGRFWPSKFGLLEGPGDWNIKSKFKEGPRDVTFRKWGDCRARAIIRTWGPVQCLEVWASDLECLRSDKYGDETDGKGEKKEEEKSNSRLHWEKKKYRNVLLKKEEGKESKDSN